MRPNPALNLGLIFWEYRIGGAVQKGLNVMTVRNGLIVEGRGYTKGKHEELALRRSTPTRCSSCASLRAVAAGSRAQLERVAQIVSRHRLRPVVARVFGFDEARRALAWYAEGQGFGKTVIRVEAA